MLQSLLKYVKHQAAAPRIELCAFRLERTEARRSSVPRLRAVNSALRTHREPHVRREATGLATGVVQLGRFAMWSWMSTSCGMNRSSANMIKFQDAFRDGEHLDKVK